MDKTFDMEEETVLSVPGSEGMSILWCKVLLVASNTITGHHVKRPSDCYAVPLSS